MFELDCLKNLENYFMRNDGMDGKVKLYNIVFGRGGLYYC